MRTYLERLAAAAISPGGSFHPLAGGLYAAAVDPRPPAYPIEAEAHETHQPAPAVRTAPPFFAQQTAFHAGQQATSFETATPDATGSATFPAIPLARVQPLGNPHPGQPPPSERVLRTEDFPRERPGQGEPASIAESPLMLPLSGISQPTGVRATDPQTGLSRTEAQDIHQPSGDDPPAKITPAFHKVEAVDDTKAPRDSTKAATPPAPAPDRSASLSTFSAREAGPSSSPPSQSIPTHVPATRTLAPITAQSALEPAPQPTPPDPSAYQPLVANYTPPPAALALQRTPQTPQIPALRDQPQTREPDEIQIHIGRIEVTAYQPAAAAVPQPAPRRTPSLDSYLRRGTGRV